MYRLLLSFLFISKLLIIKRFSLVIELIIYIEGIDSSSNFIPLLFFFFIGIDREGLGVIFIIIIFNTADFSYLVGITNIIFRVVSFTFFIF